MAQASSYFDDLGDMLLLYLVVCAGRHAIVFTFDSGVSIDLPGRWKVRTERTAKCIRRWRIGVVARYE
jgi:hypothetical protein